MYSFYSFCIEYFDLFLFVHIFFQLSLLLLCFLFIRTRLYQSSLEDADNTHPNLEGGSTGDCFLLHKFCWSDSNLGFTDRHT